MVGVDLRERAQAVLPPEVLAYYDGASGDGQTADEATSAWRAHRLRPRVLRDVSSVDTRTSVGGVDLALPVLLGPCALHGLAHPDGERATVAGAVAGGSLPVVSARASVGLADMDLPAGRWWQQLYVLRDRGLTREVAGQARERGAAALVVTGDAPVLGRRRAGKETLAADQRRAAPGVPDRPGAELADDVTLADAVGLARDTGLPFWVKGVLRADDALLAVEAGAAGVVVSNHGGRQLDGAVATAHVLREVAQAVGGRAGVLVDGGVRSGRDVVTALALGADAVLLGRRRAGKETLAADQRRAAPGVPDRPGAELADDVTLADAVGLARDTGLP
ncbi:MAG: L-lactate dehydrogenase, partial [Frankiales bacterium]|nr:L-lactate dehydrogenase [Frankiales bacterium]